MKVTREVEERIEQMICSGEVIENGSQLHREDVAEKEFQAEVIRRAAQLGWSHYHVHDSRRSNPGWPDLCLWRERIVFMELKSMTGRLTKEQMQTIDGLRKAGAEVYVLRPSDWPQIETVLTRRTK